LRHNELAKLAQCGTHTLDPCWLCCRAGAAIACTLPARQRHGDTGHVAGGMWGNRGRGELCQYPIRVSDDKRYLRAGRDYSSCEDFAVPLRLRARSRRETGPENGRCSGSSPHGKHGASCQLTPSSTATFARDVIGCRRAANRFARATAFAVWKRGDVCPKDGFDHTCSSPSAQGQPRPVNLTIPPQCLPRRTERRKSAQADSFSLTTFSHS